MARKAFFRERTAREIISFNSRNIYSQRNLVRRIVDTPEDRALILRTMLIPGNIFSFPYVETGADASRAYLKHAPDSQKFLDATIRLSQPQTYEEALRTTEIPATIRLRDLSELTKRREEEIRTVGYCFRPVFGRDRRLRFIPFYVPFEGAKIRTYEETQTRGSQIEDYSSVKRAAFEGGDFVVRVPSRTKKSKRYPVRVHNFPFIDVPQKRAIAYSIKTDYGHPEEERSMEEVPPTRTYGSIRKKRELERAGSDIFTFIPQDAAAIFALINEFGKPPRLNFIPMEQSQFAFPSRFAVEELWRKLGNNLLIYDPTLESKHKLRKLHLAEKCILLARSMARGNYKPEEILWWEPGRDGKISEYHWNYP